MKKVNLLLVALFAVLSANVMAQDEESYINEENLRRYAIMMEAVDAMKSEISVQLNEMIKNQEGIDGNRYTELKNGEGEAASEFEQKFMTNLDEMVEERKKAIGEVVNILATKMLPDGGRAYKAIKEAIETNPDVKAQYEAILVQVQLANEDV